MKERAQFLVRALLSAFVLLLPLAGLYRWQSQQAAVTGTPGMALLRGQAEVLYSNTAEWRLVSQGALGIGDAVRALDNVRLTLSDGTVLDLEPGALLQVRDATANGERLVVRQEAGRLAVETQNPGFRLETASASLSVQTARFRVEVNGPDDTFVATEQGHVFGQSGGEAVSVPAGEGWRSGAAQRVTTQPAKTPVIEAPPPPSPLPTRTPVRTPTPVPPTATPSQRFHTVAAGETLSEIAQRYGATVDAILRANNMSNPNMLSIGAKLLIP